MPDYGKDGVSLYECSNAHVRRKHIYCTKGYILTGGTYNRLAKGCPLTCSVCQKCSDFDRNGEPIEKQGRGWQEI